MDDPALNLLLDRMVAARASDLLLSAGAPPSIKVDGRTRHLDEVAIAADRMQAMAAALLDERQRRCFEAEQDASLSLPHGSGRFRINIYRQRGEVAMAVRFIPAAIPTLEALHLPARLQQLVLLQRGLVLVVGAAGSGKSTALAAMLDHRNRHQTGHILCIEDPIEFLHQHRQSVVDQREVGVDTPSFDHALRSAMREAPDVIMIGEIRDRETMQSALNFAETGHLCLSTMHSNNANQALDRIINFFPDSARHQVLADLALNLRAVVSLRLVPALQGGLLPATELLLQTAFVSDLIQKGDVDGLKSAMQHGNLEGMCTFDQSLFQLLLAGRISRETALEHADSRTDLALQIRLHTPAAEGSGGMALEDEDPRSMRLPRGRK